jgi:hypothetical protein
VKKRVWVPAVLLVAAVAAVVVLAQERNKGADIVDKEGLSREMHTAMKAVTSCSSSGPIPYGQTVYGETSYTGCASAFSGGMLYANFYVLYGYAGHTVRIDVGSLETYLATIQDYNAGTVLASTGTCGFSNYSCSFTYTFPTSGNYVVGFGSENSVGAFTLLATDLGGGGPEPTPVPTRGPAPTPTPPPYGCYSNATQACLNNHYTVWVRWSTTDGRSGNGNAIPVTGNTAYFWFFSSDNVELVVKVLDGTSINGHTWCFYGALSNVHYWITVTDTVTGRYRVYENPQNTMASVGDTAAF